MTTTTATATATKTLTYRGIPYQKRELHQTSPASRRSAPMLTYRGVSYGADSCQVKATPMACPLRRMIELQFLGNHYQRAW